MSTRYETPWCLLGNIIVFQRGKGTKSSLQQMLLKLMEAARSTPGPSHLTLGTLRPLLRLMAASVAWVPQIYTDFFQTEVMRIKENQVSYNSSSQYHWKWKWINLAGSLLLLCSRFGNRGKRMAWVLDFFSSMGNVQRALDVSVRVCLRLPTHFPSCMLSFAASVEHGGRNSEKTTSIFYR